jgi:RNA polymerase sigma-70 factor (family 1)
MMNLQPDDDLLVKVRSGDKNAFDTIYHRHWLRLYRIATRITQDDTVAEDIIQDTFISFWEKGCRQEIRSLEAYLYQAVKFRCFMHLRSGSISRRHLDHLASISASIVDGLESYELEETENLLQECISSLPERCREVYYLSRVEHLPNKKIAERLHISTKTVENQITKALKQLRLSLNKIAGMLFVLF